MANINISTGTKIFLRVLGEVTDGEVQLKVLSFSNLKRCYFGLGRAKETATTAFYNQLQNQIKKTVVVKTEGGYTLGPVGKELRLIASQEKIDLNVKSEAQQAWELKNTDASEEDKVIFNG